MMDTEQVEDQYEPDERPEPVADLPAGRTVEPSGELAAELLADRADASLADRADESQDDHSDESLDGLADEQLDEPADQPLDEPADEQAGFEFPDPPQTGDPDVDQAIDAIARSIAGPLEEQVAVYEAAHRTLQDRLADVEG